MINLWRELEPGLEFPNLFSAVVEVPQNGRNKYRYLRDVGVFKLDRVLTIAANYPGDYGFVPQTLDSDGDPVNILVMTNLPTFPGCIIEVRPLGLLRTRDHGQPDDKVLAVLAHDPFFAGYHDHTELPPHYLREVEHFFAVYKDLDASHIETAGWESVDVARAHLQAGFARFWEQRKRAALAGNRDMAALPLDS